MAPTWHSCGSEVAHLLRRSHPPGTGAILNPSMGHKTFLKGMDVGSFSRNHVSLEINLQTSRL